MRIAAALALMLLPLAGGCATGGAADVASASTSASAGSVETLDTASLASMIDTGTVTLVDVRTPEEVAEGHLDGMMALDFLASDFEHQVMKLDPHKSYYLYCRSGKRSEQACLMLSRKGFENVTNLQGGYLAWLQK